MVEPKAEYPSMEAAAEDAIKDAGETFTEEELNKIGQYFLKWRKAAGYKKICRWLIARSQGEE